VQRAGTRWRESVSEMLFLRDERRGTGQITAA
jgi:hypothetical protein